MKQCEFCEDAISKYKCPKCQREYCSVECYKCQAHLECSEKFYKDCFMEGLKEEGMCCINGGEGVAKMLNKLNKVDETMPDEDLENIFKLLSLGKESEEMWDILGREEKGAFISMHSNHDFSPIITTWKPWWQQTLPKLIQDDNHHLTKTLPKLFHPPLINTLISTKAPSTTIPFDIINTLYGYCYVSRLHNGDLNDLLLDSAHALTSISTSLTSQTYDSVVSSIDHCIFNLTKDQPSDIYFVSNHFSVAIINDVVCVLKASSTFKPLLYVKSALSHSRNLLKKACLAIKKETSLINKLEKDKLNTSQTYLKAFKKIEFYLSWIESNVGIMEALRGLVELILHSKMTELNQRKAEKELIESHMDKLKPKANKTLIEEI